MPQQEILEEMVVKLMGDGSSYAQMWMNAQKQTSQGTSGILAKINQFEGMANKIGQNLKSFGAGIAGIGTKFSLAITAPLSALAGLATRETTQYEAALSRMKGLVGLTSHEIAGFSEEIKKLSVDVGKGPLELARALENITSSGIKGEQALETLQITARAAAGGLGEVRSVSDTVTSAMNAYGVANLSATEATDILVAAVREGKAEAESFAPVLGNVLPIANEMGISFDEAAGSIAYLTLATGSASTAATQYQNILAQVIKLNEKHDSGKILKAAGVDIKKFQKDVGDKGLLTSLMKLKDTLTGKGLTLKDAFPDVQAMTAALQLTGANAEKAKQVIESVGNAKGSVNSAFSAAQETRAHKFNQQMAEGKIILLELGDILQDVVGNLMGYATIGIDLWKSLSQGSKKLVVDILSIAAAVGPVLVGVGLFITLLGGATTAIGGMVGAGVVLASALASWPALYIAVGAAALTMVEYTTGLFSDMGKIIYEEVSVAFNKIKEIVAPTMKGMSDAIYAGKLDLVFEIGTNAIKIGWLEMTGFLKSILNDALTNINQGLLVVTHGVEKAMFEVYRNGQRAKRLVTLGMGDAKSEDELNNKEAEMLIRQGKESFGVAVGGIAKEDPKLAELKKKQDALNKKAAGAAKDKDLLAVDPDAGLPEKLKGSGGTFKELPKLPELKDLDTSSEHTKKVHVEVDFKTVGAGSGAHLDLMMEYMSGKPMKDVNVRQGVKTKAKTKKQIRDEEEAQAIQDEKDVAVQSKEFARGADINSQLGGMTTNSPELPFHLKNEQYSTLADREELIKNKDTMPPSEFSDKMRYSWGREQKNKAEIEEFTTDNSQMADFHRRNGPQRGYGNPDSKDFSMSHMGPEQDELIEKKSKGMASEELSTKKGTASTESTKTLDEINKGIGDLVKLATDEAKKSGNEVTLTPAGLA